MNSKQIRAMLEQLVERLDYDHYKGIFVPECIEDPEETEALIVDLESIVNEHLSNAEQEKEIKKRKSK